jgi:hypothetical protein
MQPRELYGVLLRAGGALAIVLAAFDLFHVAMKLTGYSYPSNYTVGQDVVAAFFYFAIGALLIVGAERITRLVYGSENRNSG